MYLIFFIIQIACIALVINKTFIDDIPNKVEDEIENQKSDPGSRPG